ncbi:MAG: pseudouridine synthase [Phycisphaerales bacterium]
MTRARNDDAQKMRGADSETGIRLHKYLAHAGVGSRRACEDLIAEGHVKVNGRVVETLPAWVDPKSDNITVKGRAIAKPERHIYVMLYKPRNTVSTVADPDERRTVSELVDHPSGARLYPVGRLDYDSMGLVLMTNDGELANAVTHPKYGIHKTYRVIVRGQLTDEHIERLQRGIYLAARESGQTVGAERVGAADIDVVRRERERTIVDITLTEGRNRQIRRLLASVGCHVKKLTRIQLGPLSLKGLAVGEWRELTPTELSMLRKAVRKSASAAKKKPTQGNTP